MTNPPNGRALPPEREEPTSQPYPVLSNRAITWAAAILVLFGGGLATILLLAFGDGQHVAQLDAIKTAGTIVLGTGGAAALWLTARRQRTTEIALTQKHLDQLAAERAHALQERVAEATSADAEARRITELYGRAVDQLGSDKAPVRLGGLYALRRLAQDNPVQRQTIVDVICAYLRMPYEPPGKAPAEGADSFAVASFESSAQERQVRLAAERVLTKHLHPGKDPGHPDENFWAGIDVDLNHATLLELSLRGCRVGRAYLDSARFVGRANFSGCHFSKATSFIEARFEKDANFRDTRFGDTAHFTGTIFRGDADFSDAHFSKIAGFMWSAIHGNGEFDRVAFKDGLAFSDANFAGQASFSYARFERQADFGGTNFSQSTYFSSATFSAASSFWKARFHGSVFIPASSFGNRPFNTAELGSPSENKQLWCWVRLDREEPLHRQWPPNWVIAPCPDRPHGITEGQWGRLVPEDESLRSALLTD